MSPEQWDPVLATYLKGTFGDREGIDSRLGYILRRLCWIGSDARSVGAEL